MVKRVVLGIGNPGPAYDGTRHNVGFAVLDVVAARCGLNFRRLERVAEDGTKLFSGKVKAQVAEGRFALDSSSPDWSSPAGGSGDPFLLVKPLTYVNLSGDVAAALLRVHGLPPESLFVIVDDLNLPLGRMRIRPAGSPGGHNGLASIEQALGRADHPRLRLGIGPADGTPIAAGAYVEHVLSRFLEEEREVLGRVVDRAATAACDWLRGESLPNLMDRHNGANAQ